MKFEQVIPRCQGIAENDWKDWKWQLKNGLQSQQDFAQYFNLSQVESAGFAGQGEVFQIRTTPYYASLAAQDNPTDPIRLMMMPNAKELSQGLQSLQDPLGEKKHSPVPRIIHRYSDRVLFLVTDFCSVYCRYCTRKHFTGQEQALPRASEYEEAINYIRKTKSIREVILSGGDPLTLSDSVLLKILVDVRSIPHVEIIRIGTRMPVVCPMRITPQLAQELRKVAPLYIMTHFNHPRELTQEAYEAVSLFVDHGIPVFNQMVLLNGVNNHPAIVQALSRRLLYARVKPYYMFQCDPSMGTDHLRTSVDESLWIQKELWGHLSGLAMPNLSLDIPGGGGKVGFVPQFQVHQQNNSRTFKGWDGVVAEYISPPVAESKLPDDVGCYLIEWNQLKGTASASNTDDKFSQQSSL